MDYEILIGGAFSCVLQQAFSLLLVDFVPALRTSCAVFSGHDIVAVRTSNDYGVVSMGGWMMSTYQ